MSIKINDLSVAVMLLENDFCEVRQGFKDIKLKDFDNQLKCRCSSVFQNQLIEVKELIEKSNLIVIKENFNSCVAAPLELQENGCELGFVKERAEEVNTLVRQKLDKLGSRIAACDKGLTALCSLIDSHIEGYTIKGRLAGLLSVDPTGMNQAELDQVIGELKDLEKNYKQWAKPRSKSLREHILACHGSDKVDFVQALSDMKLKCNQRKNELQREKFLGDVEFVLDGLRDGSKEDLQQRFADFPLDVQWKIFTCAGMVRGKLPTSDSLLDYMMFSGKAVPQLLAKTVNVEEENLRFTLQQHANVLLLCPETAFVACVQALEGCVKEKHSKDADAIQKKLQGSARFGLLKELIKLNVKSQDPETNIRRLLKEAEGKGLNVQGNKGVYFWVWFYAHQGDSSAGGPDFGKKNAHKDLDRLFLAIDEASITPELLLQRYDSTRISSLDRLKAELEKIKEHSLSGEEREGIVRAALSAAARGGVVFDQPNGVFYWVWKIASDSGEPTHGDTWGGDNAPKNIDRLLKAINLAN